jgi:hypothetical protein
MNRVRSAAGSAAAPSLSALALGADPIVGAIGLEAGATHQALPLLPRVHFHGLLQLFLCLHHSQPLVPNNSEPMTGVLCALGRKPLYTNYLCL